MRLRDPDGELVGPDELGEVEVRGEPLLEVYWNEPERTAEAMSADGFYRTGDLGTLSSNGYLTLADRGKDMIISSGENVYPREVELVLDEHRYVAEAAAIGITSERASCSGESCDRRPERAPSGIISAAVPRFPT